MADELSPADRSSLAAEQGPVSMAVGGVLVFEHGSGRDPRRASSSGSTSRLHLIPRYRQRLQQPTPGGFTNPVWVDDEGFDAGWHVRARGRRATSARLRRRRDVAQLWTARGRCGR